MSTGAANSPRPSNLKQRNSERQTTRAKKKDRDTTLAATAASDSKMSDDHQTDERGEGEPLLGHPGDATQKDKPLYWNLVLGEPYASTAVIAQLGIWLLFAVIWGQVLSAGPLMLVHAHPLTNAVGLVLTTQAILIVQPTRTQAQKITGTYWHASLNELGFLAFLAGLIIIEVNKFKAGNDHFYSPHAILGLVTYIVLLLQVLIGIAMFFLPSLLGGTSTAKSIYKYHRASGYVVLVLTLATVCAATQVSFNLQTLKIKLWTMVVASVILLVGLVPRIRKGKFGF